MRTAASFEQFEEYFGTLVETLDDRSPNRELIRAHFGLDAAEGKRGKRLRPRILVAVAESEGAEAGEAFGAAAAVELLHNFSLVHDDIEDRDEMRHGRPTLWCRFGIGAAVEAGNAMCALAYRALLDGAPSPALPAMLRALNRAHGLVAEGQSHDIRFESAAAVSFPQYLAMIERKTAALFAASCELGALAAGAPRERAEAWARVGRAYGLAFQVRDDVLGTWGAPDETGKPAGADVRRRKWSFPIAWAASRPPSPDRDALIDAYARHRALDDERAQAVIAALHRLGAPHAAEDACARLIAEAVEIAGAHGLDGDGRLSALFEATANRTA